jgi:hypothetical protein
MNGNVAGMLEIRNGYRCWCRKTKQGDYLENLGVYGKILKRILKNMVGRA